MPELLCTTTSKKQISRHCALLPHSQKKLHSSQPSPSLVEKTNAATHTLKNYEVHKHIQVKQKKEDTRLDTDKNYKVQTPAQRKKVFAENCVSAALFSVRVRASDSAGVGLIPCVACHLGRFNTVCSPSSMLC